MRFALKHAKTPTAYAMSGFVAIVKYINKPTTLIYGTVFIAVISSGVLGA